MVGIIIIMVVLEFLEVAVMVGITLDRTETGIITTIIVIPITIPITTTTVQTTIKRIMLLTNFLRINKIGRRKKEEESKIIIELN